MEYERIEASEVRVGDRIAQTRNRDFHEVTDIAPGPVSDYISLDGAGRIRPRHTTKLWREVASSYDSLLASDRTAAEWRDRWSV